MSVGGVAPADVQDVPARRAPVSAAGRTSLTGTARRWLSAGAVARLKRLRELVRLFADGIYDLYRFARHANLGGVDRLPRQRQAHLMREAHRIEKGMSLPNPRPLFGQEAVEELIDSLSRKSGPAGFAERVSVNVLHGYIAFNDSESTRDSFLSRVRQRMALVAESSVRNVPSASERAGGVHTVTRDEIWGGRLSDPERFFQTRHSIRSFSKEPVALETILRAIAMAQSAPSVCNRQGWRCHVLRDGDDKLAALTRQNGNRGFRDDIDTVLVVTGELGAFLTAGERNQHWVDGGMFAMSIVYALHALGLGTCCLNWSRDWADDKDLRRTLGLEPSETVIMMIAVGNLPPSLRVCDSPRRSIGEVAVVHSGQGAGSTD
jgi:nitroreductase